MNLLLTISAPLVQLFTFSTDLVLRLFGKRFDDRTLASEEEITTLLRQGTEARVFEEIEQKMIEAIFELSDKTARGLMTSRTQIIWLDVNDSDRQIGEKLFNSGHSRFPVCNGASLDNVVGIVQAKDLSTTLLLEKHIDLNASMQPPDFVPWSMTALQVLEHIKKTSSNIVLVADEYGSIEGLLTYHNILEAIAGDMPLGTKPLQPRAVQQEDGSWVLDGMLSVEEFKELFHIETLPGEKKDSFQTLGGFLFIQMGRVPSVSECFVCGTLRFWIINMDGKRIDKVLISPQQ